MKVYIYIYVRCNRYIYIYIYMWDIIDINKKYVEKLSLEYYIYWCIYDCFQLKKSLRSKNIGEKIITHNITVKLIFVLLCSTIPDGNFFNSN